MCFYFCHPKQSKEIWDTRISTKNCFFFIDRYQSNWGKKPHRKLIFQCFPYIYVKRKLQHNHLSWTTPISILSVCFTVHKIKTMMRTIVVLSLLRNVHHFPVWILAITENHNNIFYMLKFFFNQLNRKINKYEKMYYGFIKYIY